jgi:hypothetical protein
MGIVGAYLTGLALGTCAGTVIGLALAVCSHR